MPVILCPAAARGRQHGGGSGGGCQPVPMTAMNGGGGQAMSMPPMSGGGRGRRHASRGGGGNSMTVHVDSNFICGLATSGRTFHFFWCTF